MKEDRATVLLKATLDILRQCDSSSYVLNALEVSTVYDEAVCDGFCLKEDIEWFLESDQYEGR